MKPVFLTTGLHRLQRARTALFQRIPFSREHGLRACEQGRGAEWFRRSETMALRLDGVNIFLLMLAAALGLPSIFFYSRLLAIGGGSLLALAMFNMAAELWIEREESAVREAEYRRNPNSANLHALSSPSKH